MYPRLMGSEKLNWNDVVSSPFLENVKHSLEPEVTILARADFWSAYICQNNCYCKGQPPNTS